MPQPVPQILLQLHRGFDMHGQPSVRYVLGDMVFAWLVPTGMMPQEFYEQKCDGLADSAQNRDYWFTYKNAEAGAPSDQLAPGTDETALTAHAQAYKAWRGALDLEISEANSKTEAGQTLKRVTLDGLSAASIDVLGARGRQPVRSMKGSISVRSLVPEG